MNPNDKPFHVVITSGTIIKTLLLLLLGWLIFFMRDLALIILTAIVLASAIEPALLWLHKKKVSRVPGAIIIYLSAAIMFVGTFYFFLPPLLDDVAGLLSKIPADIKSLDLSNITKSTGFTTSNIASLADDKSLRDTVSDIRESVSGVSGGIFQVTGAIFGGVASFVLIVVLSFYFAVQETGIDDFLRIITPVKQQEYVVGLWRRAQAKIGLWMQGQILLGLIVAVLTYLVLTILSVPYAFFLAVLAGIFELIPVFGPILSAIPAVAVGFTDGGVGMAGAVLLAFLIIQQFENHLIYPLVVRKVVGIPPIMVILALIAGAKLAGFLGVILSVPVSAGLKEYIDDIQRQKEKEKNGGHLGK